ncbi:MAG: alpha-L-rhamnosidase-related protein [Armatimonadota bacterium]
MARILINEEPFQDMHFAYWAFEGNWPASWIDHPERPQGTPSVAVFRRRFRVDEPAVARLHVSADNRYRLFLDGEPLGSGPERGDPHHWRYESYEVDLTSGEHVLTAMSWWLTDIIAPQAQMSVRPGFLLAAEGTWQDVLSTGIAPWEALLLPGFSYLPTENVWGGWTPTPAQEYPVIKDCEFYPPVWGTGARIRLDGTQYPWGCEAGGGEGWTSALTLSLAMSAAPKTQYLLSDWLLTPAALLPQHEAPLPNCGTLRHLAGGDQPYPVNPSAHLAEEALSWQAWLDGTGSVTIPAGVTRTAIIDLDEYYCAYPQLRLSGGAGSWLRLRWAEALYEEPKGVNKGNRDAIDGKYCVALGNEFLPDGGKGREFFTLWWECGRYLELTVVTGEAPVTLERLTLTESRYPLEMEGQFSASDERLAAIIPIGKRALQMCMHETYMDCPYYEQLMYTGDTRMEVLTTYALTRDDRLPRKAVQSFDQSRLLSGLTRAQYPSKCVQLIPPFALWWMGMAHDYWQWRDDPAFVRSLLPSIRAVGEHFRTLLREDGLLDAPHGWNFTDWVPGWKAGVPPGGESAPCSIINLQFVLALGYKANLEDTLGDAEMATRDRATAVRVMEAAQERFWHKERGLIADDMDRSAFSEHAQSLAILTGLLPDTHRQRIRDGLLNDPDLSRATIYFTHYLFEAFYALGRGDKILERLALWFALEGQGFKTTFEEPEPTRSDCHGWGAHPILHYYTSLLGIRPAAPGFHQVRIAPRPGGLAWLEGILPHPAGAIHARLDREQDTLHANIVLPPGVTGVFAWQGEERVLASGKNTLTI